MIDEYLKSAMEEDTSSAGSGLGGEPGSVEKSLAELDLAAAVNPAGQLVQLGAQPALKMAPRPGPMVGGMGEASAVIGISFRMSDKICSRDRGT